MEAEEIVKYVGGHDEYCLSDCDCVEIVKKALLEAANGAYEDAAKVSEDFEYECTDLGQCSCNEKISEAIRQKIRRSDGQ